MPYHHPVIRTAGPFVQRNACLTTSPGANLHAMAKGDLSEFGWNIVGELNAGETEVVLADHPAADWIDRTHLRDRPALSLLLSPQNNPSRGCFLGNNKTEWQVSMGNVVLIPPGMAIRVRADTVPPRRLLNCTLPIRGDLGNIDALARLEQCMNVQNGSVRSALQRMGTELQTPGFAAGAIIEGLGIYLAGELANILAESNSTARSGGLAPWQLRRIDEHLKDGNWDCRISQLAAICGISARHLMRAFRQSTGRSLADYIAAVRADHARTLLHDDRLSISEIARQLRFSRPAGFTTAFRRMTGLTPSAYRQFQRARH